MNIIAACLRGVDADWKAVQKIKALLEERRVLIYVDDFPVSLLHFSSYQSPQKSGRSC